MRSFTAPLPRLVGAVLLAVGCADSNPTSGIGGGGLECALSREFLVDGGVPRDGIPSLDDPEFVATDDGDVVSYVGDDDRVVGFVVEGRAYAVPHRVLWWHEIVNVDLGGHRLAVTYCPLTGSSLVFDRSVVGGAEFGVSGLLFKNNLIMYDRRSDETLWSQMLEDGRCGPETATRLDRWPAWDLSWEGWKDLHPGTKVVRGDSERGTGRFQDNPYPGYDSLTNEEFLFPNAMPEPDPRRPAKERVIGIPARKFGWGWAFPFGALTDEPGPVAVVAVEDVRGGPAVVFWDDRKRGGMAFRPVVDGESLQFIATDSGIRDVSTGSTWGIGGVALSGELKGSALKPIEEAFVAFWGAWSAFRSQGVLWTGASTGSRFRGDVAGFIRSTLEDAAVTQRPQ